MNALEYKKLQNDWVTGNKGGSEWEIQLVTGIIFPSLLAYTSLLPWLNKMNPIKVFLMEFTLFIIPQFIAFIYPDQVFSIWICSISIASIAWMIKLPKRSKNTLSIMTADKKNFLEIYRAITMVMVVISIYAVDFAIYPKKFMKTETFGASLMDIGVGCMIFNAGLFSQKYLCKRPPFWKHLRKSLFSSLPLFMLGMIRVLTVKSLDYQEHVSEYGVHWNFFLTLACLSPLVSVFNAVFGTKMLGIVGVLLASLYQAVLENTALTEYLLSNERVGLFAMNKEGIVSVIGYLSLFLLGVQSGSVFFDPSAKTLKQWRNNWFKLILYCISYWIFYVLCRDHLGILSSRRLVCHF